MLLLLLSKQNRTEQNRKDVCATVKLSLRLKQQAKYTFSQMIDIGMDAQISDKSYNKQSISMQILHLEYTG